MCFTGVTITDAETVNRIVAVVNDAVITEADVVNQMNALLEDPEARIPKEADPAEVHRVILRRLIEQQVILQEARRAGIVVSSDEVAARMDEFRQRFESDEAFQQSLAEAGVSEEQLKESVRDQLLVQRVVDSSVRSTISVSPQEVARELEAHPELAKPGDRVRASHLLVRVDERRSEAQARVLIEDLHRQLAGGAEFAELAKRYSEDSHREDGGAMGWVAQGELLPELDTALFNLPAGQLSEPIQTRLGFHLLKAEERRSASSLPMTEANNTIQRHLYQQKYQAALSRWLTDLKRRAYIEIVPPPAPRGGS